MPMPTINTTRATFDIPTPPSSSPQQMNSRRLSSATTVVMTPPSPVKKVPWRPPGTWEMPDIIQECWKQKQLLQPKQPTPPPEDKKKKEPPTNTIKVNNK